MEITAKIDGPTGFTLAELGVMLEDGTLLAVWSDPETPLAQYTPGVPIAFSFVLALAALPQGIIEVSGDVDLQLFFGEEFAQLATSLIGEQLRNFELVERLAVLEKHAAFPNVLSGQISQLQQVIENQQHQIDGLLSLLTNTGALALSNARKVFETQEILQ